MLTNFEPVPGVIKVRLPDPFEKFYCIVIPAPEYGENYRTFYLMCEGFGVVVDMFSCAASSDQHAAQLAAANAPDYIEPGEYF